MTDFVTRGPGERVLARIADACAAAPLAVLAAALLTGAAAVWVAAARLEFRGSRDDIATAAAVAHTSRYLEYRREFPDDGSLVVVVDGRDPARAGAFADALAPRLAGLPEVSRVFYRIDPTDFGGRALLYLPAATLARLRDALAQGQGLLSEVAGRPGLVTLVEAINREVTRRLGEFAAGDLLGPGPEGGEPLEGEALDVDQLALFARALARAVGGGPLPSVADAGLPGGRPGHEPDERGGREGLARPRYLFSDNGRFLFLLATPAAADAAPRRFFDRAAAGLGGGGPVQAVRAAVADARRAFPGLDVGVIGPDALAADERATTQRDVALAVLLGFAGNVVPLLWLVRRRARTAYVLASLAAGLAWSFGFATLAIGHLNMLSAVFASILIGVGINFPIHLLARYEEAEREGHAARAALALTVVRTGGAVGASALVLVASALAAAVADLPAIVEMGVISAAGLGLNLLAAYTVLPALLALEPRVRLLSRRRGGAAAGSGAAGTPAWARVGARLGRARWALVAGLLLTLAGGALVLWRPPRFDSNLLDLQARASESARYEQAVIDEGGRSTWFVVTDAADLAEVRRKAAALAARPLVDHVESVLDVLPEDQPAKARIVRAIRPLVAGLDVRRDDAPPFALEPFRSAVSRLAFKLGAAPGGPAREGRDALVGLLAAIERAGPEAATRRLAAAQAALVGELAEGLAFLGANVEPTPVTIETLPADLRARFVGRSGRLLLRVYPKENTWEGDAMARFLADVRAVEPGVTGTRVQGFEVTETIRRDYLRTTVAALAAIALFALVAFRSVKGALLAMLPVVAGGSWTLGLMAAVRLDFNLANLFAVPLVIGVGVDSGMNLVARAREEPAEAAAVLDRSVGKSVLLASLTTIWGFGALLAAQHRGIASLGLLLTLGSALTSLAAFTVLPPALGAVARSRRAPRAARERRLAPSTAALLAVAAAGGVLASGLSLGAPAPAAAAPAPAGPAGAVDAVRGTIEAARAIIRDPALTPKARDERVRALIAERFDTGAMGEAALGRHADQFPPAARAEYTDLFTTLFSRSYSRMVLSFLDRVEVRYGQAAPAGGPAVAVPTTLLKAQGETLPVDYRLEPRDGGWVFTDVVIDGLSLVASYRSQFDRAIRAGGARGLLERMRARREQEP